MKKIWFVVAGLFAYGLVSLGLLGACVIHAGGNFSFQQDEKATRQETHALEISAGQTLRNSCLPGASHPLASRCSSS